MKSNTLIIIGVAAVIIIGLYATNSGSNDDYQAAILKEREDKDRFMKQSDESPFGEKRDSARSLSYFAPDPKYKINADFQPIENKKVIVLPTSSGEEASYLEYGWVEFELDGIKSKLLLLEVMAMGPTRGTLFLAFADETSAKETYGGGRYLDLKKSPGMNSMTLDFNKAYNPYCAYVENFSCPLPPRENMISVAIKAGEKTYK